MTFQTKITTSKQVIGKPRPTLLSNDKATRQMSLHYNVVDISIDGHRPIDLYIIEREKSVIDVYYTQEPFFEPSG